jgi:hypothetical protein
VTSGDELELVKDGGCVKGVIVCWIGLVYLVRLQVDPNVWGSVDIVCDFIGSWFVIVCARRGRSESPAVIVHDT